MRTNEIKNEVDEIKKWEENFFKKSEKEYVFDFLQDKTISFGDSIYTRKINIVESDKNQSNLLKIIVELNNKSTPRSKEGKD